MEGLNKSAPKETTPENDNSPEKKEKIIFKKANIFFEQFNSNIELPIQVSEFEYPEEFKKETGIIGYERTLITKEVLIDFLNKNLYENFGINSKECDVNTLEDFFNFQKKLSKYLEKYDSILEHDSQTTPEQYIERLKKEGVSFEKIKQLKKEINNDKVRFYREINKFGFTKNSGFSEALLSSLTNGEYPLKTLNHKMSGFFPESFYSKKYQQQFVNDKFFMQKIYGIETAEKIKVKSEDDSSTQKIAENETIFSHYSGEKKYKTSFLVFEKNTNKLIKEIDSEQIIEYSNQDNFYLCSGNTGLNTTPRVELYPYDIGSQFSHSQYKMDIFSQHPSFGFFLDNWFNDYIKKIIEKYIFINNINKKQIITEYFLSKLCRIIDLPNLINKFQKEQKLNDEGFLQIYYEESNLYLKDLYEKNKHLFSSEFLNNPEFIKKEEDGYLRIPVFMESDEIPQLRWGHAKYSHFMTSKGLNVIKMKHSDNFFNH